MRDVELNEWLEAVKILLSWRVSRVFTSIASEMSLDDNRIKEMSPTLYLYVPFKFFTNFCSVKWFMFSMDSLQKDPIKRYELFTNNVKNLICMYWIINNSVSYN